MPNTYQRLSATNRLDLAFYGWIILIIVSFFFGCQRKIPPSSSQPIFQLKHSPIEKKVDVLIDDQLFTAYRYPDNIAKPILYPINTPKGIPLTRGYPIDSRPGERVDHPHHVGHWLNYGDVNGLDFWNNSEAIPIEKQHRYGRIVHQEIEAISSKNEAAQLHVAATWESPTGKVLLDESTSFVFTSVDDMRVIERITKLTARDTAVSFQDNKEGFIGIRVSRSLEFPTDKPLLLVGQGGVPNAAKIVDNSGVNGNYLSSTGQTGSSVWGTRAKWMKLHGEVQGEESSLVIVDHPDNPGYPTYWHARDYGLFAANPLGQAVFSKGKEQLNFSLKAGESVSFKYQILVHSGSQLSAENIEKQAQQFAKK